MTAHTKQLKPTNGKPRHPRRQLADLAESPRMSRRAILARYDAAQDTDEIKNYWANADALDADTANSLSVRQIRISGWMPMLRSSFTLCWVGFVFSS